MSTTLDAVPQPLPVPHPGPQLRALPEDRARMQASFERQPFPFHHSLHRHPLFTMPALLEAAERIQRRFNVVHFESGEAEVNGWFGSRPEGKTLTDALAELPTGNNWVGIKRIHEDPAYGDLLRDLTDELSSLTRVDFATHYTQPTLTVFCTSPGRITPYHMDAETNFLAQVQGPKHIYIYNSFDPEVLRPEDLERYWTGALPHPIVPPALPFGTWPYLLEPGTGVFNPASFPHWVQNGPEVSISVSINFAPARNMRIGAYRTNRYLRKIGLRPSTPGRHPALDRAKALTFGKVYLAARAAVQQARARRS